MSRNTFTSEYLLLRSDGVHRWVLNSGVPRYAPDSVFLGYIGSAVDLTDRKEAEGRLQEFSVKLINVQDAERSRIGQQLHDDLAQRVLALSIGLTRLEQKYGNNNAELECELRGLDKQAVGICKEIAHLSRQLRPVTLERVGLPFALRSLCEEATTHNRVVLFIQQEGLPAFSETASVSLYRIAQEALRNALTHSGAPHINIELSASETAVRLSITDEGCGFIVEAPGKSSLGLSGMAERMKNAGGDFVISSSPGNGTTVTATMPIVKAVAAR